MLLVEERRRRRWWWFELEVDSEVANEEELSKLMLMLMVWRLVEPSFEMMEEEEVELLLMVLP